MNIILPLICSIIMPSLLYIYINYMYTIKEVLGKHKSENIIYSMISSLFLIMVTIILGVLYPHNTIIHNVKLIFLLTILFVTAVTDYRDYIIPNEVIIFALIVRAGFYVWEYTVLGSNILTIMISDTLACLIPFFVFLFSMYIVTHAIGMGDIKLMILIAIFQGMNGAIGSIFWSLIAAFVVALLLLIFKKKKCTDVIPLAPFMLIGTCLSIILTGM